MTNRQVRFVSRILVMMIVAGVAALAARIAFESRELAKLTGESGLRDLLLILSPISTLALLQYSLAIRSHGIRSLSTEGLAFLPPVCLFLLVVLPWYFGSVAMEDAAECAWWKLLGCTNEVRRPSYIIAIMLLAVAGVASYALFRRESLPAAGPKSGQIAERPKPE